MKIPVYGIGGEKAGEINVVKSFSEKIRQDLIKKAVIAERSKLRQPYGTDPLAGKRTSAHYHGKRHYRYSMMNREIARMKRIHGRVGFLAMTARFVPQAIKGRKAHPPKIEKNWVLKINKKERDKAILSAIAASADKDFIVKRGHKIKDIKNIPLVVDDKIQEIKKIKDLTSFLEKLGLKEELKRTKEKKIRAGRGKIRNRKYVRRKGPLLIIKEDMGVIKASQNIPGVDVVELKDLTTDLLAPGTIPGRLCVWSKSAVEEVEKTGF